MFIPFKKLLFNSFRSQILHFHFKKDINNYENANIYVYDKIF
jgi:hypothetical protein